MNFSGAKQADDMSSEIKKKKVKPFKYDRNRLLWKKEENLRYADFIQKNARLFETEKLTRGKKVFRQISQRVETKTACQCRSHHQKMMQTHESIEKIVVYLNEKYKEPASSLGVSTSNRQDQRINEYEERINETGGSPSSDNMSTLFENVWNWVDMNCWTSQEESDFQI